jgi:Family of unknown function (DUF6496)
MTLLRFSNIDHRAEAQRAGGGHLPKRGEARSLVNRLEDRMAKYGSKAQKKVRKAMHERKRGTLKSGRSGKKVKSRKQAIAIGLAEARREGGKVPAKKSSGKKSSSRKSSKKSSRKSTRKSAAKKK